MYTIGVISDTHGLLRPQALEALQGSDLILHAGDVGDPNILLALGEIAPTFAVYGNTDHGALRAELPHSQVIDLVASDPAHADRPVDGSLHVLAYVLHIREELDLEPGAAGMRMMVFGHTHEPLIEERDGVLWMNPGSAGPRRFSLPVTVGRVTVDGVVGGAGVAPILAADIVDLGIS
ncbi:MAG: metallophosphoesterase family protein [Gemmatimonadetes bacterium]|jgi:uncharacterized protein|nr:metallophosphoesterase family protein [Gemmatimonadota bacterium]